VVDHGNLRGPGGAEELEVQGQDAEDDQEVAEGRDSFPPPEDNGRVNRVVLNVTVMGAGRKNPIAL
jgi:hypothetical protein